MFIRNLCGTYLKDTFRSCWPTRSTSRRFPGARRIRRIVSKKDDRLDAQTLARLEFANIAGEGQCFPQKNISKKASTKSSGGFSRSFRCFSPEN